MRFPRAALGLALLAAPAAAHVTLDASELPADGYVRVALRVGHGCQGAATTAIRVTLPPGLPMARPMPHAGWTLTPGGGEGQPGAAPRGSDPPAQAAEDAAAHGAGDGAVQEAAAQAAHARHAAQAAHARHAAPAPAAREIAWTGGRLDDALYDEFVLFLRTPPTPGAILALPVVQECEGGRVARWTEAPPAPGARVANPAPFARLVAR